jgi:hypothetical protein
LYVTNAINNVEQVVGATYDRGMNAASMHSSSPPYVDPGGRNLISRIGMVMLLAGIAVVLRKRYLGLTFRPHDSMQP